MSAAVATTSPTPNTTTTSSPPPADRSGPSLALADLLAHRADLVPPPPAAAPRRATALVPGAGRAHDARLLAGTFGYDVWVLDHRQPRRGGGGSGGAGAVGEEQWQEEGGEGGGCVTWLAADFFDEDWSRALGSDGSGRFDLVFDYEFLSALPPDARPRWAKRVSQLLEPRGRLVCLEYPSSTSSDNKPSGPWAVSPEAYEALLSAPGEAPSYAPDGAVVSTACSRPRVDALHRLSIIKPTRTHAVGTAEDGSVLDFISVWAR
ncbi:thiopurine s-methyltransferase (TPMT) domain-containing protein [Hirsutella rhossiliensis]|uniref:Thiopurine s-methyltransferase (TPMT) domain-containing protein n=1 Tax=Hirsutella rhossiliensis TaxID=111463 RepID=A0A9P8SFX8_9HYPO|nr:thiopurine s-methyltransferase (TPMT) domain-containing protein [Hirsutella rhossiliensis]KAH0959466.1 thiopurine s-methyltransferase (TPMT) domain-containing protein [Hirsutella rhossiliensis]